MNYIHAPTGQYPVTEQDIRAANPNTSFPSPFRPPEDYQPVFTSPPPDHNYITEILRETSPELTSKGHYEQTWVVEPRYETVAEAEAAIARDLQDRRDQIWEQIKAIRDNRNQTGGYQALGKWFHSDTFSRSQQLGLVIMGDNIPPGIQWRTMDGSYIEMTPAVAQDIFRAAAAQDGAIFQHAEWLKSQVDSSETPTSIDITLGWPPTYPGN